MQKLQRDLTEASEPLLLRFPPAAVAAADAVEGQTTGPVGVASGEHAEVLRASAPDSGSAADDGIWVSKCFMVKLLLLLGFWVWLGPPL